MGEETAFHTENAIWYVALFSGDPNNAKKHRDTSPDQFSENTVPIYELCPISRDQVPPVL